MESLNVKTFLNKKVKNFISRKINDGNINVDIKSISFLKPDWPNIARIELNNVNIYSLKQRIQETRVKAFKRFIDDVKKNTFPNKETTVRASSEVANALINYISASENENLR